MPTRPRWKVKGIAIALMLSASLAGVATAGGAEGADGPGANAPASSSGKAETPKAGAADPNSPVVLELKQLEASVAEQTRQFDQHSKELDEERAALHDELARIADLETKLGVAPNADAESVSAPVAAAVVAVPIGPTQQSTQATVPQDWSTRVGNLEDRLKDFGPFSFSGDIRLRDEPFFGGPSNQSLDQNRERFRVRFNINAKLNDDFSGGFSLASGDINDPTTTNQTLANEFSRKTIAIDKAYVEYNPHEFHELTLIGGKFAYPWYNTELTWDKDLNPDGAAETLVFNTDTPVLKKVAFVGFELPFAQISKTLPTDQSAATSIVYGGQFQTTWQFAPWLRFGAFTGYYDYHDADAIALALARASSKNPQTPLTGLLPLGTGNTPQNSILTTTATNVVTVGGTSYNTGVTSISNAQFESKFGLFDSIARFDITTPSDKWPIAIIGDYVQNTEACANVPFLATAPVNTSSVHYSQSTNFSCDANQRRGYWGEIQVGRAQKRGDWQFDYTRIMIEREAVLSNFDYSDIRQGSNVSEHRAMVIYQVHRNVQTSFTALIGRPLNLGSTTAPQPWLERLQFDLIYTF